MNTHDGYSKTTLDSNYILKANGGHALFHWPDNTATPYQSGTPTYVWGGAEKDKYYLYRPSEFIVSGINRTVAAGSNANLVFATIAANDFARINVGGSNNNGYLELATADDGNEPIYVRQYTGVFSNIARTLTLLDGSGNSYFPGTIYKQISNNDGTTTNLAVSYSNHSHNTLNSDFTVTLDNTTTNSGWSMIEPNYRKATVNSDGTTSYTGSYGFILKSVRGEALAPAWFVSGHSAGIAFGGFDTKGVISMTYNTPVIKIAGGNGTTPVWWIGLSGTSGTSYNLNSFLTAHQSLRECYKWFGYPDKSNMNDIARLGASTGMTSLSAAGNIVDNPYNNDAESTSWHLYFSTCYRDGGAGNNAWVALIANKAGTELWWVRSRAGGTVINGSNWGSNWRHLVTSSVTGIGETDIPVYVDKFGQVQAGRPSLYFINGTNTSTSGNWTGALPIGITAYYNGMTIRYRLSASPSGDASLKLGELTSCPVYMNKNSRVTTHYPLGSILTLTYYDGGWYMANYDSATYDLTRLGPAWLYTASKVYQNSLIGITDTGKATPLSAKTNTNLDAAITYTSTLCKPGILYVYTGGTKDSGVALSSYCWYENKCIDLRYTDNCATSAYNESTNTMSLLPGKPVYMRVEYSVLGWHLTAHTTAGTYGGLSTYTRAWTQDSFVKGGYYMYIGIAYNTYCLMMMTEHPIYYYDEVLMDLSDWNGVRNRPTTLSGYGITDAATSTHTHTQLNTYFNFKASDIDESATNLLYVATPNSINFYRNGIVIPLKGGIFDGGMFRVKGSNESDTVCEVATWDDSGAGETIQFNYYPVNSRITPTYSVSVPKKTGTIAISNTTTDGILFRNNMLLDAKAPNYPTASATTATTYSNYYTLYVRSKATWDSTNSKSVNAGYEYLLSDTAYKLDGYSLSNYTKTLYKYSASASSVSDSWYIIAVPNWHGSIDQIEIVSDGNNMYGRAVVLFGSMAGLIWGYQSSYNGQAFDKILKYSDDAGITGIYIHVPLNMTTLNVQSSVAITLTKATAPTSYTEVPVGIFSLSGVKLPARTITLSGSVTGSVSFDGSSNVTISTTTNHNHDGRYVYNYGSTNCSAAKLGDNYMGMTTSSGIDGNWWHILSAGWNNEYRWNSQIGFPTQDRSTMYFRSGKDDNSGWGSWKRLALYSEIPTKVSQLSNDSKYITIKHSHKSGGRNYFKQSVGCGFSNGTGTAKDISINGYYGSTNNGLLRIYDLGFNGIVSDWTVSFYIKASTACTANINLCDVWADTSYNESSSVSVTTSYVKHTLTFLNVSSYITSDNLNGFFDIEYSDSSVVFYVKDLKIERGTVATDWSPAPEDLILGTTFYSGNGSNLEHNANNIVYNGHFYYSSNGPTTTLGATTDDGALYSQAYSTSWVGQIAQDYRNGRLFFRGKNNNSWTSWLTNIDSGNIGSQSVANADTVNNLHVTGWGKYKGDPITLNYDTKNTEWYVELILGTNYNAKTDEIYIAPSYDNALGFTKVTLLGNASYMLYTTTYNGSKLIGIARTSNYYQVGNSYYQRWILKFDKWAGTYASDTNASVTIYATTGITLATIISAPTDVSFYSVTSGIKLIGVDFIGNLSGNASSATKLTTSHTLWGQSFNGTADVSGNISNTGNITPSANNTYSLGLASLYYKNVYARVLCGETSGTDIYHRIAIGYPGNDRIDFDEFGGAFYFNKTNSGSRVLMAVINSKGYTGKNIYFDTDNSYTVGSTTAEASNTYTRQIYARHLDASAVYTGDHNLYIGYNNTDKTYFYAGTSTNGSGANLTMSITPKQVGINTSTPTHPLDVNGAPSSSSYNVADVAEFRSTYSDTIGWSVGLKNAYNANATGYGVGLKLALGSDAERGKWSGIATVADSIYANTTALLLYSSAAERIRITGGGNVGIGTSNPSYKLHVVGDIYSTTGFKKGGSNDNYVLLGGGGHKALSSVTVSWDKVTGKPSSFTPSSHTHSYLPLSGGTVTGVIYSDYKSSTYVNSLTTSAITLNDSAGSYGGWICGPTKDGRITIATYLGGNNYLYFGYGERNRTTNSFAKEIHWDAPNNVLYTGGVTITTDNFGPLIVKRNDDSNGATILFRGKSNVYGYIGFNNAAKDGLLIRWKSDTSVSYTILDTSSTSVADTGIFTINSVNPISKLQEGTSNVTDGTMFITSYATNNGFADTNAVNVPYKRKASCLYNYIKGKTDSLYSASGHTHAFKDITGRLTSGNEFNFVDSTYTANTTLYFNYLPIDNRNTTVTISGYKFCNGAKNLTWVNASKFVTNGGNASLVVLGTGELKNISDLNVTHLTAANPLNVGHSIYCCSVQKTCTTTATAGYAYPGSSGNYQVYSFPGTKYTYVNSSGLANLQLVRFLWGTSYFHELFMSPNLNGLWYRSVINLLASAWGKLLTSADYNKHLSVIASGYFERSGILLTTWTFEGVTIDDVTILASIEGDDLHMNIQLTNNSTTDTLIVTGVHCNVRSTFDSTGSGEQSYYSANLVALAPVWTVYSGSGDSDFVDPDKGLTIVARLGVYGLNLGSRINGILTNPSYPPVENCLVRSIYVTIIGYLT